MAGIRRFRVQRKRKEDRAEWILTRENQVISSGIVLFSAFAFLKKREKLAIQLRHVSRDSTLLRDAEILVEISSVGEARA